jgi:chromosome segregation ATPase
VIEPALYFILGFLSSGLLALIIAPSIWSRAVRLTRRRIEASQPLTLAEIRADRDQLRADFAVTSRRLELNIADLRLRSANQRIEVGRALGERDAALAEQQRLAADVKLYQSELSSRGEGLSHLQGEIRTLQSELDQRNQVIGALELRMRELNSEVSSQQLEIASLNTRLEASGSQIDALIEARRLAEARVVNLTNEIDRRGAVIAEERERAERLQTELGSLKSSARASPSLVAIAPAGRDDNERPAINRLEAENAALETRLRELTAEHSRLAGELQATKVRDLAAPPDAADIALLKDRLGDMAARIAHMASEGNVPTEPLDRPIANPPGHESPLTGSEAPIAGVGPKRSDTLAEKIRALREAASTNERA